MYRMDIENVNEEELIKRFAESHTKRKIVFIKPPSPQEQETHVANHSADATLDSTKSFSPHYDREWG